MSTANNLPQVIPFIQSSAFETVLTRIFDILVLEEANQRVQAVNFGKSQGSLTLAVQPTNNDDMTVGPKTYIFQDTLTDVDGNIQIGVDLAATQANIVAAFDLSGVAGTQYAASMTAHPSVDIAAFALNIAILTAKVSGVAGNDIATTSNFNDGGNLFDGATLGGVRQGQAIDPDDYGFNVAEQIANPFQAKEDFFVPLVNVMLTKSIPKAASKNDQKNSVTYSLMVYAEEKSTEDEQGVTLSLKTVNRVFRQILYILESPKYEKLGFAYEDGEGNLIQFIEKLSLSEMEPIFPKEPFLRENVTAGLISFNIDMNENLFDLVGDSLDIINVQLLEPTV